MVEWSTIAIQENSKSLASKVCNPWTWRLANGVMALFFALAAYVQINDPDPVIWMLIYGIPCILCVAIVFNSTLQDHSLWKLTAVTHLSACIFGVIYLLSVLLRNENASKNPLKYEEGREIAGLLIIVLWLALCQVTRLKSFQEGTVCLWTATIAIAVIPFVLWGFYLATWDMSSLQNHCKDIISHHLYKQEIK